MTVRTRAQREYLLQDRALLGTDLTAQGADTDHVTVITEERAERRVAETTVTALSMMTWNTGRMSAGELATFRCKNDR